MKSQFEIEFDKLFTNLLKSAHPEDYASVSLIHNEMETPIYVAPQKVRNFKISTVFERIEKIAQSFKPFLGNGVFELVVILTKPALGRGKIAKAPKTIKQISCGKNSVVTIKNNDHSCGFRALFVSMYHLQNKFNLDLHEWSLVKNSRCHKQKDGAIKLALLVGYNYNTPLAIDTDWPVIQSKLNNYQIIIIDVANKLNILFRGPNNLENKLYLEYYNNHYNSITNIRGYYGRNNRRNKR